MSLVADGLIQVSGKMQIKISAIICLLLIIAACEDAPSPLEADVGLDYFPLKVGDWKVYDVELINIGSDTTRYQLMESVVDTFSIMPEEISYILHRFSRSHHELPWELDSAWTARLSGTYAVVVENNVPLAKVQFPVGKGETWDGNTFNNRPEEIFEIASVDQPFQLEGETFSRSMEIIEKNVFDTLIVKDIQSAVYARRVGLIYKRKERIDFCRFVECLGEIESGILIEQRLVDYGQE